MHPEEKATVRTEAEIGVLQWPARTPGTGSHHQKLGRGQGRFYRVSEEHGSADT